MKIQCPICSLEASLKYKLNSNVYYCGICKLYFAPNVKFNFDFVSELDEQQRAEALKNLRIANFNKIIPIMKNHLPPEPKGLEVGSAYGWFLELAEKNHFQCYGIEPEERMYLYSKNQGLKVIKGFFPEDLPDGLDTFDFIIFNDVFEHIPDVNKVLNKCYELLNRDGILIINLPISSGIFYKIADFLYLMGSKSVLDRLWQFNFHSPHYFYFNNKSLQKIALSHGFEIINYSRLDTLDSENINSRIRMDKNFAKYSNLITPLIKCLNPIFNQFKEDIGCFYFKKQNKGDELYV